MTKNNHSEETELLLKRIDAMLESDYWENPEQLFIDCRQFIQNQGGAK